MEIKILKYGNLMGSPDLKEKMSELGASTPEADKLWDDLYEIKIAFGLNGQSTSLLLIEPDCPELFPAVVDCSYICADPASYSDASISAALAAIAAAGVKPDAVKSYFVTHSHGDHLDPRLAAKLPEATVYAHPDSKIHGAKPLPLDLCPAGFTALDTPGHGTPHCSYIVDLPERNLSACIAGDLIMSHAHYLSLGKPLSFSDAEAGAKSVRAVMDALAARNTKYKMIIPGHDIPFFV
jgi:glyoxylase-like metal-dependent hydrolase (beta-lactamase superfamily II)